jgi:hypothetical protein
MADDKAKIDWKMLEESAAEPASEEVAPAPPAPVPTAPAPAAAVAAATAGASSANKIVFYCSNGHRVVVPATMSGQRGKCSKCGVAVRIPASSQSAAVPPRPAEPQAGGADLATAAEPPAGEEPSRVTASDSNVSATEFVELSHQLSDPHQVSDPGEQPPQQHLEAVQGGAALPVNPTAALVARLFQEMAHGGIVEVHIAGGSVILPEFYEPRWSAGSHGLFASRAADGTVTLTAVAWDSIQKIIVRQVNGLPDGMFE